MMANKILTIIACSKEKKGGRARARDMYTGPLFKASYTEAESDLIGKKTDLIAILSSKYGLLKPDQEIEHYDKFIGDMSQPEKLAWANIVGEQFDKDLTAEGIKEVIFLASEKYQSVVRPIFEKRGIRCRVHPKWKTICDKIYRPCVNPNRNQ